MIRSNRTPRLTALLLLLACAIVSGCSKPANEATNEATLVVTTEVHAGNNSINFEFTWGTRTATADVEYHYNDPTGESSRSGTLAPIYELITGTAPETPNDYQTMDSILTVLFNNGWEQTAQDRSRRQQPGAEMQIVETIQFRKTS